MATRLPDKDRKDRRLIVLAVLLVVALAITTLWFREPDTGPLHTLRSGVSIVTTPFMKAGRWAFTPVRAVTRWTSNLNVDRDQLDTLRTQNEELRTRVMELEEGNLEAARLRSLLDIHDALELESVGARVIGGVTDSWSRTLTIDRGSRDGIALAMPVLAGSGLLGQVVEVGPDASVVRLITDQRSGVAVFIQSNRAEGVVRGTIGDRLLLDYISDETTVTPGDVIITSGMGGVYPKGLVVGEVESVGEIGSSIFREIQVRPAQTPVGVEEVLVIVGRIATVGDE